MSSDDHTHLRKTYETPNHKEQDNFQNESGQSDASTLMKDQRRCSNAENLDRNRKDFPPTDFTDAKIKSSGLSDKSRHEKIESDEDDSNGNQTPLISNLPKQRAESPKFDMASSKTDDLLSEVEGANPVCDESSQYAPVHQYIPQISIDPYNLQRIPTVHLSPGISTTTQLNASQLPSTHLFPSYFAPIHPNPQSSILYQPTQQMAVHSFPSQSTAFHHNPHQSTTLSGTNHSVNTQGFSVKNIAVDMTAHKRTVIATLTHPSREQGSLKIYMDRLLPDSRTENIIMDTFAGDIYITFILEKSAQQVCQMIHDPVRSNIQSVRLCQPHEFDFFNDRISVHGELLREPASRTYLCEFILKRAGVKVLDIIQVDCACSGIFLLGKTLTITEISRLLLEVSIHFLQVLVAPVKTCFIISVKWDQRKLTEDDVVGYITWTCKDENIKQKRPSSNGLLFYLSDKQSMDSIISSYKPTVHILRGIPFDVCYFHPYLTAETYRRFEEKRFSSFLLAQTQTAVNFSPQNSNCTYETFHPILQRAGSCQGYENTMSHGQSQSYANAMSHRQGHGYEYVMSPVQRQGYEHVMSHGQIRGYEHVISHGQSQSYANDINQRQGQGYEYVMSHVQIQGNEHVIPAVSEEREFSRLIDGTSPTWSITQRIVPSPNVERPPYVNYVNNSSNVTQQLPEKSVIDFSQDKLVLLERTKFIEEVEKACKIQLSYDKDKCQICLLGDSTSLKLATLMLKDHVNENLAYYDLTGLNNVESEIINTKGFPEKINEKFKKKKIPAFMSCDNGKTTLLYDRKVSTAEIEKIIRLFLVTKKYKIEEKKVLFYQSKKWSDFLQKFQAEHTDYMFSVIHLNTEEPSLLVVGSTNIHDEVEAKFKQFEEENKIGRKTVNFDNDLQEYARNFLIDELKDIKTTAKGNGATVEETDNGFIIQGLQGGVSEGASKLEEMRDSIKSITQTIDYPGCKEFLETPAGRDILWSNSKKYSCLIKLFEQGVNAESADECPEQRVTLLEWGIIKYCKVGITRGEPEDLKVDCIFNFINTSSSTSTTMPKGFIGGQSSWIKLKEETVFSIGQIIEFVGEKNRNLKIFHIFCNHEEKQLVEALRRGFNRASAKNFKCIGISLDGINDLERKPEEFSKSLAEHLNTHICNNPNSVLEIYLCGNNEPYLQIMARHLKLKYQPPKSSGKYGDLKKTVIAGEKASFKPKANQALTSANVCFSSNATGATQSIQFKPILVELISGDILAVKADAIVTSIQSDLNMNLGLVIRSVLQKGGDEIQKELNTKYPLGIKGGEFAVSGGGRLPVKRIYHATLTQWNVNTSGDVIKSLVKGILQDASKESLTSIAIPALGTGNLQYDSAITSKSILSAISDFVQGNQQTTLTSVKLVIFSNNTDILKEYGNVFSKFESASLAQANMNQASTTAMLQKSCISLGNIEVKLTVADISKQKTHAIVVSADQTLDLNQGKVAKTILTNGGQGIQLELQQKYPNGLKHFEYAMTGPGNLQCQAVYFVSIPQWSVTNPIKMKMHQLIVDLLTYIDNTQAATVSFPALGTGTLGYPPDKSKKRILKAIAAFAKRDPKNLRCIEIVVYHTDYKVQQVFQKGLNLLETAEIPTQLVSKEKNESTGYMSQFISSLKTRLGKAVGFGDQKSTINIGNVTLTAKIGDLTEEMCDILVAAVSDNMNLETAGTVSREISKKCTENFKSKCLLKAHDLKVYGVTSQTVQGGSLKCKEIFFINTTHYNDKLDLAITKVLESADKSGYTSLALPAFGTGIKDADVNQIITQIMGAITKFCNEKQRTLKDIRLVVYDKDMLKRVSNANSGASDASYVTWKEDTDSQLSESAQISYYFVDEHDVRKAMEEVVNQCLLNYKENRYRNISIKKFTDTNFKDLEKKGIENMIKVKCIKDEGIINMTGFGDMSKVQNMINTIEHEMQREMLENYSNDTPVHWQYKEHGRYVDFNQPLNIQLEADFKGKKKISVIELGEETYNADLEQKTLTHHYNLSVVKLRRRDALEAGEPIPDHWEEMTPKESLKIIDIPRDNEEYKQVAAYFKSKGAVGNVCKIERVQNRPLYQQFVAKRREIEGRNPNNKNELLLFHGSDIKAISAINKTGFNRSYCGKNATVYGHGVYFAESSAYSERYSTQDNSGLRKLYQVRVLVGVSVETDCNTKFLPKQPGTDIPYDSGRAPASRKEGIHVIFHDSQAYPEYIITFS